MMRRLVAAAGCAAVLSASAAAASEPVTVEMTDRLDPQTVTVPVGTTVTWRNADDERHRVRSTTGPERLDSGNLEPSQTWSHTFSAPGEYRYVDAREPADEAYWGSVTVTGGPAAPGTTATSTISLTERAFSPDSASAAVGEPVMWVNTSDREHTVTADDGSFDSGVLPPGGRFTHTFTEPASVGYFCAFHGGMRGTVDVGGVAVTQPADPGEVDPGAAAPGEPAAGRRPRGSPFPPAAALALVLALALVTGWWLVRRRASVSADAPRPVPRPRART